MCGPKIKINEASYLKIKEICASFNNNPGELINVLHKTQEHFGYLPEEVQQVVADCLGILVGCPQTGFHQREGVKAWIES